MMPESFKERILGFIVCRGSLQSYRFTFVALFAMRVDIIRGIRGQNLELYNSRSVKMFENA